jgi:choline dehydrogenase
MKVVIAGAGTAGCVLAARLSADPGIEVLLLESGPHYRPGEWPPELTHAYRIIKETHDWGFTAQAGASPRGVHVPRGQVVGGSSITNATIALRGLPEHYDDWAEFVPGLDWQAMLPWLKMIEADQQFGDRPYHGDRGPIPIDRYPRDGWYPLMERFAEAALARGHQWVDDHNEPGAVGIGPTPFNMRDGVRQTPADLYLDPALSRGNLTLRTGVRVDRLVLDGTRATGLVVMDEATGERETLEADHVILCLGTYQSPAVLLRSGVGPAEAITPHGIAVAHELPGVGRGMQDHPKISYRFWVSSEVPQWPHPWIQALLTSKAEVHGEERLFQVMPYVGFVDGGHRISEFNVQVADSRGRTGRVDIQSTNPMDQPVLRMGWLEAAGDRDLAEAAGRELMAVARTEPLAEILDPWPNLDDPDHALRTVETFHHPVATLRMGQGDDPMDVTDGDGRLRGLEGAWCIDASIIPRVPSANTHLAVIALSEKLGAQFLEGTGHGAAAVSPPVAAR